MDFVDVILLYLISFTMSTYLKHKPWLIASLVGPDCIVDDLQEFNCQPQLSIGMRQTDDGTPRAA